MCSARDNVALPTLGFPIRASAGHWPFSASPRLIAAVHALLRLLVPRHPPCALPILTVIRHLTSPKAGAAPGDTRLLAWLCSFQGPRRGARPAWAPGLSKLNSMRPPVLAPKGRRRSRRARSSRPRAEGLAARAGGRQVRSTLGNRLELGRRGMRRRREAGAPFLELP